MTWLRNMFIAAALLAISAGASADDHASNSPLFYGQSFGFVAEDAGAVVAAMEKWRSSKAGKAGPNTVVLIQNIVNGDYDSTHGVNVFYQNGAAMDASAAASNGTQEWAEFQSSMAELTEREWENMYAILRAKVNDGDVSSPNPVSMILMFYFIISSVLAASNPNAAVSGGPIASTRSMTASVCQDAFFKALGRRLGHHARRGHGGSRRGGGARCRARGAQGARFVRIPVELLVITGIRHRRAPGPAIFSSQCLRGAVRFP